MGGRLQYNTEFDKDPPATYEWKDVVWYNVFMLTLWHIGALYAVVTVLPYASLNEILVLWIGLWVVAGLGITMGAHRLWSHQSFKAALPVRIFLMLANSMAFEGTIFEWSRDHRVHHKGSETNSDPYNARRGFFFSHIGWVMVRKQKKVIEEGRKIKCDDLLNDPVVTFQMNYYKLMVLLCCYIFPTWLGWYCFNNMWNGFWIGGVFRHIWVLHMTWFVNSIDHYWGARPYDPDIQPVENLFVAIVALGEGWHNYHHKYPSDYATSEFGTLGGNFNPTKTLIDICAFFGLAHDLRRSRTAKATRERVAAEQARKAAEEAEAAKKQKKEDEDIGIDLTAAKTCYQSFIKTWFLRRGTLTQRKGKASLL